MTRALSHVSILVPIGPIQADDDDSIDVETPVASQYSTQHPMPIGERNMRGAE